MRRAPASTITWITAAIVLALLGEAVLAHVYPEAPRRWSGWAVVAIVASTVCLTFQMVKAGLELVPPRPARAASAAEHTTRAATGDRTAWRNASAGALTRSAWAHDSCAIPDRSHSRAPSRCLTR